MANRSAKLIDAENIGFDELNDSWVSMNLGSEKFVMDMDTLIDLSFRCASFLAYLENKEETVDTQCGCYSAKSLVH